MAKIEKEISESDEEIGGQEEITAGRTAVAEAISKLRDASFRTARERERVPQPLFWSLFASQLQSIKRKKAAARLLNEIFGPGEE